jgi:hypothetical protein
VQSANVKHPGCACPAERKSSNGPEAPEQTARIMLPLNNKYALDGRAPLLPAVFGVLGRYGRRRVPGVPHFGPCSLYEFRKHRFEVFG